MATTIKLKNSVTTTAAPSTLVQGEAAVNITDKKLWVGDAASSPVQIVGAGAPVSGTTGTFTSNVSVAGTFAANGGATLGDASGDALTINSSAVSIPNGLNFDSNTFVIDATNNRVGIGQASPASRLDLKQASDNWYSGIKLERSAATTQYGFISSAQGTTYVSAVDTAAAGNNVIVFGNSTDGTTLTERMRITSTGNVGIGTSSPSYKLDVNTGIIGIGPKAASLGNAGLLALRDDTGTIRWYAGILNINNQTSYSLYDAVASAERLVINSSGNLGLGVTPSAWGTGTSYKVMDYANNYAVGADTTAAFINRNGYYNGTNWIYKSTAPAQHYALTSSGQFQWYTAPSGTAGNAITFTQAMTLSAAGGLSVGTTSDAGAGNIRASGVVFAGDGSVSNNAFARAAGAGTGMYFPAANTVGFSTAATERMRIDSSGNLLIGVTSFSGGATVGLQINATSSASNAYAQLIKNSGGTEIFQMRCNGGLANYSANDANLSDERVKTNIELAGSYLDKICAIPVKTFKYKDQTDNELNLGVIAQDVEAVAPELVDVSGFGETPEDGVPLKAIYQTDLQYALMKCIQEQQAIITDLKARIETLESK